MTIKALVWIRDDLRIEYNSALSFATNNFEQVTALYIYDKEKFDNKREAQKWWLSKSLESFKNDLFKFNINLELVQNKELDTLTKIKSKDEISVYWNKIYEPSELKKDEYLIKYFQNNKINFRIFKGNNLLEFQKVVKNDGTPFKVFTPFWKNAEQKYLDQVPRNVSKIRKLNKVYKLFNNQINIKQILPEKKWHKKFENYWNPSESEAKKYVIDMIKNKIQSYGVNRDYPGINGTSKISPFLRHGQINVENLWKSCQKVKVKSDGFRKYINELGWREFSHSLINNFPEMLKGNLRKEFDKFPWVNNKVFLSAWKEGQTGYPIVDAGMRELYETGWMHNRIRMVVGSFLVKHLRINWKEGEKHFRNCLFDFNEANNVAQWQWVAGCGADAAPYFRIFNPILQGEKFDKEGLYVKKWVPELSKVPNKFIHKPWEMELKYQEAIKTIIGKDYPKPIVIHEKARASALEAFQSLKKK